MAFTVESRRSNNTRKELKNPEPIPKDRRGAVELLAWDETSGGLVGVVLVNRTGLDRAAILPRGTVGRFPRARAYVFRTWFDILKSHINTRCILPLLTRPDLPNLLAQKFTIEYTPSPLTSPINYQCR
ncbi:hypothetical protein AG1IA_04422 [Rhizoctonia solani AG-1 IA]|uniref:Uncharacterized protein n=1 Tax=Thanatephorus cucumeris (strain AG1-IA) TaxID=983506 RepID=L8WU65_THACA|nr:hypothetical protein AG1IA_04422 [Rhizoctonia solani AG-1 IA]